MPAHATPAHLAVAAARPEAALTPHAARHLPAGLPVSGAAAARAWAGARARCSSRLIIRCSEAVLAGLLAGVKARGQHLSLVLQQKQRRQGRGAVKHADELCSDSCREQMQAKV